MARRKAPRVRFPSAPKPPKLFGRPTKASARPSHQLDHATRIARKARHKMLAPCRAAQASRAARTACNAMRDVLSAARAARTTRAQRARPRARTRSGAHARALNAHAGALMQ
eukprot:9051304-Pyramimonas_sp.AAC.2